MSDSKEYQKLVKSLSSLESCAVAFSGGLDSTLLLWAARDALGKRMLAMTISTPYIPAWEIREAIEIAENLEIQHRLIKLPLIDTIKFNPEDRCYRCKKYLFTVLKEVAGKEGIKFVLDGTNKDDLKDYRPGMKAIQELNILSPLLQQGFTKKSIKEISRLIGIANWQKPASACLLSRIPYGHKITILELKRIEKSEKFLMDLGFSSVRVRSDGALARIEVRPEDRKKLFDEGLLDNISRTLKGYGYTYTAMELEGYQMGSMNRVIKQKNTGRY